MTGIGTKKCKNETDESETRMKVVRVISGLRDLTKNT